MEKREELSALFLYASEGILIVDSKGIITRINPSIVKLFGYSSDELIGQKVEVLIPQRFAHNHVAHRDQFYQSPHPRSMGKQMELWGIKKSGEEFPVEVSLSPFETSEGLFVIAFIIDATFRKEAEKKLKNYSIELEKQVKSRTLTLEKTIKELEKIKKELSVSLNKEKELHELKTQFVSIASHEFKTPLTTMMSSVSLIDKYGEKKDLENQKKHLEKVRKSIRHLNDLLNDFLSTNALEEGKISNNPSILNIPSIIKETISELEPSMIKNPIFYTHQGEEETFFDPKILKTTLTNLLSNAIKFSIKATPIEVFSQKDEKLLSISVKDQGIGIPEKDQARLLAPFFRAKNANNIQGTGLGLNIVARHMELVHGKLLFSSQEGLGSTFTLQIPQ